ncbi:MAG: sugar phosphate isomerase/epimerase family protein [Candidatus Brocadiia bacterium]
MKLSCCAYSYRELLQNGEMTLESFLDVCAEIGMDGVELTQYYFPEETDRYLNHIKREVFRRGLDVSGTAVGGNFSNAEADKRHEQINHVKDWIVKSARLGSPVLRVFAGARPEGVEEEVARRWVREGLTQCAVTAAKYGVVLGLESHGGLTSDADGILDLVEPTRENPWVGINLDFGNFTGDVYQQYARCAPLTVTTHAKVTCRQGEERMPIDYRRVVRIMREAGYDGYLAIEYEEPDDPMEGVDRFAAYLRGCIVDA